MSKFLYYFTYSINKKFTIGSRSLAGRNFSGSICVHHKSGGNKTKYSLVDFYRRINSFGYIYKILKSPFFTGFLGGIIYENGLFSYILLSENVPLHSKIYSGTFSDNKIQTLDSNGITIPLKTIKLFTLVNNIEKYPFSGGSIMRAAGAAGTVTAKSGDKVSIKLNSGWNLLLSKECIATIGNVSNMKHRFNVIKKAGLSRLYGIRPTVRGVAMNPCDHPHGGGEGKKSPPAGQRSPWGWLTKGTPSLKKLIHKKKKKLYKIF